MKLATTVTCPYCGFENHLAAAQRSGRELRGCNYDKGGCDGTFVVEYTATLTATVRRIEGEERHAAERDTAPTDGRVKLADIRPGGRFSFGGVVWVKLNDSGLCLSAELVTEKAFDGRNCNDWRGSSLRQWLNEDFLQQLCDHETREHGDNPDAPEPFIKITSDLTADNGMTDYGTAEDLIALLTCDLYREYRDIIPPVDNWYWTLTPWSCDPEYSHSVRLVHTSGVLSNFNALHGHHGVRPLCNLSSEILVSVIEGTEQ